MIIDRILKEIPSGTEIPKPAAKKPFTLKGAGIRRGERAVVYKIPSHTNENRPHEKGITESEFEQAFSHLRKTGELTRSWFNDHLAKCANEGGCNFTTIGGLLELLGEAEYSSRGVYVTTR